MENKVNKYDPNVTVVGSVFSSYEVKCPECGEFMTLAINIKERSVAFGCKKCGTIDPEVRFLKNRYKIKLEKIN